MMLYDYCLDVEELRIAGALFIKMLRDRLGIFSLQKQRVKWDDPGGSWDEKSEKKILLSFYL